MRCNDLAVDSLASSDIMDADLIAFHLPMHTASRLALQVLPRVSSLNSHVTVVCYGNYAVMNEPRFRSAGARFVFGGEAETRLADICSSIMEGRSVAEGDKIYLQKQHYPVPDRSDMPELSQYSQLLLVSGSTKLAGYTEATRGCKHMCGHCPVVPIYQGRFFAVDRDIVLRDVQQQVEVGAEHITFGDPDFFNGPTHGMRIIRALAEEFPSLTYDVTIKVEHLLRHVKLLPTLRETGCLFITTAVESFDDRVLRFLNKGHSRVDFEEVVASCHEVGLNLVPTFVAFTPWTTPKSYMQFLREIVRFGFIQRVPVIQYALRLLVPEGSYMIRQAAFQRFIGNYDSDALTYDWTYEKPEVKAFEEKVRGLVGVCVSNGLTNGQTFMQLWKFVHAENNLEAPTLPCDHGGASPTMTEPWYCCAEPTDEQFSRL